MRLITVLLSFVLVACGGESSDDESSRDTIGAEIAEDYQGQIEKAENVEQQLEDARANIDAALGDVEEETDE